MWNKLPEEMAEVDTITIFKGHLDRHLDSKGVEGHEPNACKWNQCGWVTQLAWVRWTAKACFCKKKKMK